MVVEIIHRSYTQHLQPLLVEVVNLIHSYCWQIEVVFIDCKANNCVDLLAQGTHYADFDIVVLNLSFPLLDNFIYIDIARDNSPSLNS